MHIANQLSTVRQFIRRGAVAINPPAFSPLDLGGDLLSWWSADRPDLISFNAGNIAAIADVKYGNVLTQATPAQQPGYSATAFGGSPAMLFSGAAMALVAASAFGFPVGSLGSEIWFIVDQQAIPAGTTARGIAGYGSGLNRRLARRALSAGDGQMQAVVGTGVSSVLVQGSLGFNGRHYGRAAFGAASTSIRMDNNAPVSAAVVPATSADATYIGYDGTTSTNAWNGQIRDVLITNPLSASQIFNMNVWCAGRVN